LANENPFRLDSNVEPASIDRLSIIGDAVGENGSLSEHAAKVESRTRRKTKRIGITELRYTKKASQLQSSSTRNRIFLEISWQLITRGQDPEALLRPRLNYSDTVADLLQHAPWRSATAEDTYLADARSVEIRLRAPQWIEVSGLRIGELRGSSDSAPVSVERELGFTQELIEARDVTGLMWVVSMDVGDTSGYDNGRLVFPAKDEYYEYWIKNHFRKYLR